jgi:hypothetical protein
MALLFAHPYMFTQMEETRFAASQILLFCPDKSCRLSFSGIHTFSYDQYRIA